LNPSEDNLTKLTDTQVNGIILRAKARWHLEGERNFKYFCNLENHHYNEKAITKLIPVDEQGQEMTELEDIIKEQKSFYENLPKHWL
jgi:hypothetical protein